MTTDPKIGLSQSKYEWISHSEVSSVVRLPDGLTYTGFDLQTGFARPFAVYRTLMQGRWITLWYSDERADFMDNRKLSQEGLHFYVSGSFEISKDIYKRSIRSYPMYIETKLVSFRRSSFVLESFLTIPGIHSTVGCLRTNSVCVAMDTRKTIPLSGWWVEKYKDLYDKSEGPYFKPIVSPNSLVCKGVQSHPYAFPVPRRDQVGLYDHVYSPLYLQYCLDALEHHLNYNNIDCDIHTISLLLKTAQFLHQGESKFGDILSVAFWDDETDADSVCFDITKAGQSIYQARMQFYGGSEVSGTKSKL